MLGRLGLPSLVGIDDEEADGGASGPRQHVADEALVTRHVDDPDLVARGEAEPGEAEIDGQTASLLFGETVGVHPGQSLDQRRLSVVDVPGGAYDVHQGIFAPENLLGKVG